MVLDSRVRWDVEHERLYNENLKVRNKMVRLRDPGSERSERYGSTPKKCYNCNKIGHISRNCFKPEVDSATIPSASSKDAGSVGGGECDRYNGGIFRT